MTTKNTQNHRRENSKNDFKRFSGTFLTVMIITITLFTLFSMNLVSAWEFDNAKDYDVETKEVTIKNAFGLGSDVAKIKLNTPQNSSCTKRLSKDSRI